jgi:hypothetical protein
MKEGNKKNMKPLTSLGWRNRQRNLYTQYCYFDEIDNTKLKKLLEQFKIAFDDDYCYALKGRGRMIVCRMPSWLGFKEPTQKLWREKYFPLRNGQKPLFKGNT